VVVVGHVTPVESDSKEKSQTLREGRRGKSAKIKRHEARVTAKFAVE